jgi:hypothetical protein
MARRRYNIAEWWHLLGLDAPTIAILWSWSFARAMRLHVPPATPLVLGVVTWLLYAVDRILDGLNSRHPERLRERHVFHARHRGRFLMAATLLSMFSLWMMLHRMYARTLRDDLFLSIFALLYLSVVHLAGKFLQGRKQRWIPKELAAGVIFAVATAIPAWSRLGLLSDVTRAWLVGAVVLFALLCWINCVAIEKWEAGKRGTESAHFSTRWAARNLQKIAIGIAGMSVAAALRAPARGLMALYLASLLSSGFLLALDARRSQFSPLTLRIAADAALLTPLAFLPILR